MALGDEQIERLNAAMSDRIDQLGTTLDALLTVKIEELRELLNGISFSVNAKEIKKPE